MKILGNFHSTYDIDIYYRIINENFYMKRNKNAFFIFKLLI